ncbi:uncharacterized protein LOC131658810 [Vicia villosa]|uniref:uncharacterized protein LOC131658810 n=1 Tax=Vicia villosa TaxID=3911 RepID=UPI00273C0A67|nr:uncharacterized protein LOC131658810 [Vicia villosa]
MSPSLDGILNQLEMRILNPFKLEVDVEYDGYKGVFVFWDKDIIPYTKLTAKELREVMKKAGEDNPKIWPTHLNVLLNRKLAFRIKYQLQYQRFSIVKILHDDDLYDKFHNYLTPDENKPNAAVMEIDTTSPTINPNKELTQTSEQSIGAIPDSGAQHEGSPSASSSTPTKRVATSTSVNELFDQDELTPKQSATKAKTGKKTKHIKKD